MKTTLQNIDITLLKTLSEERHSVGPGEALQWVRQGSKEEHTSVQSARDCLETRILGLTTSAPLSAPQEDLSVGENISSDSCLVPMDGKSYVTTATTLKQEARMKEEKQQGVKHDQGKPPMELLSTIALMEMAKVMGKGRDKYGAQNWRSGLAWSRVIGAAFRHLSAFNSGEDLDRETKLAHIHHAACCLMFLAEYMHTCPNLDDRYKIPGISEILEKICSDQPTLFDLLKETK